MMADERIPTEVLDEVEAPMNIDRIKEAVTEWWGERCSDFEPDCSSCQAWAEIDAIEALQARVRELEVLAELNRGDAFAATNPANWQRGDTPENRLRHYEKTLIEISERAEDVTVLEDIFAAGIQVGRSESAVRIEDVRNQALEDAAIVAAERVRKWVDFEPPYDGDLDEAIDLVEGLPDAIRVMKNI